MVQSNKERRALWALRQAALKKKHKRQRRKNTPSSGVGAVAPAPGEAQSMELAEPELEEFFEKEGVPPTFQEVFRRFEAVQEEALPEPEEPEVPVVPIYLSRKKLKKLLRPTTFELKQDTQRPEVVEWVDTTAKDADFLIHLKAYKNTVAVPKHWAQKRKFMQLKRGTDKMPFSLPDFIEATGISKLRAQTREREAGKLLKQRMRERMNPKLGKLDIDYQVLHDAFFKYQKKPKFTQFGDVYHEGKENELKMRVYRPGQLSDELKLALGMPEGCPPPWLVNMQRFGSPPSYPHLRIPGINAPMPEGSQFPGGSWGKGENDPYTSLQHRLGGLIEDDARHHWGELEPESPASESEEEPLEDTARFIRNVAISGFQDLTPLPFEPSNTLAVTGYETPALVDLRKRLK